MKRLTLAADIGQAADYTAFVVLESTRNTTGGWAHDAIHLERIRDTPYPKVIQRIITLSGEINRRQAHLLQPPPSSLVVDATGVGKPILDALRAAGVRAVGVIITGGDTSSTTGSIHRVPKRDLVTRAALALQQGRLRIASNLPLAPTLANELRGFKVSMTRAGNERFGNDVTPWREAEHDDLVLALALGIWERERRTTTDAHTAATLYR